MFRLLLSFATGFLIAAWLFSNYGIHDEQLHILPVARLADGGIYRGDLSAEGALQGQGRIDWESGRYLEGNFQNGMLEGIGVQVSASGDHYEGDFHLGEAHGQGVLKTAMGNRYVGEFQNGLIQGNGKMSFYYGDSYEGTFNRNRIEGRGVWTSRGAKGQVVYQYTGDFVSSRFSGQGSIDYEDGRSYVGGFKSGLFHGKGLYIGDDGTEFSGTFVEGEFTGEGTYSNVEKEKYIGSFVNWNFNGVGNYIDASGGNFKGTYEDGFLTGKGSYLKTGGEHYQGDFQFGLYQGDGVLVDNDGNKYVGEFDNGLFHGAGEYTMVEPLEGVTHYTGQWHRGLLVEGDEGFPMKAPGDITEIALYNQNELLSQMLTKLEPQDPNKIDLYSVLVAGDGAQEVFRREVQHVSEKLADHFTSEDKIVSLVNSKKSVEHYPMATNHSISRSLTAVAEKMDKDEDILFVFLSSHGSPENELSLNQNGLTINELTAEGLSATLSSLKIKWKVIVISACYSGGFIEHLEDDNTLIITSAAYDKTSFGCSDENTFTWFGRAYFEGSLFAEGVVADGDFVAAFDNAASVISGWEKEEDYTPSEPQIYTAPAILSKLQKWQLQLSKGVQ